MADRLATTLPCEPFGETPDRQTATLFRLQNERMRVDITDYGGRMVRIETPDRDGRFTNVLLGFDDVGGYLTAGEPVGALLGRNANRIARGAVTIDGSEFHLSKNEGEATLHGGAVGFDKVFWTVVAAEAAPIPNLVLRHISADGDQGFPGEVAVTATFD